MFMIIGTIKDGREGGSAETIEWTHLIRAKGLIKSNVILTQKMILHLTKSYVRDPNSEH